MNMTEITKSVEVITDDTGNKKALLDWEIWEEIIVILEGHFQPKTGLGRQLMGIRERALASGMKTLSREELEQEIAERRGERS